MKIAICDDEKIYRDSIIEFLLPYMQVYTDIKTTEFCCGEDLIKAYENEDGFDVIFLDIEMKELNGIETGHKIRTIDKDVTISFLTSYKQYVFNSFKVGAFDYLIKPIKILDFNKLMDRILDKYKNEHYVLSIKWQDEISQIEIKNIIYIEAYKRRLFYYTIDQKFKSIGKLSDFESKLDKYGFLRCHQGFLVNMNYIKTIEDNFIVTTNGGKVEMSARKKQYCLKTFNKYIARYSI